MDIVHKANRRWEDVEALHAEATSSALDLVIRVFEREGSDSGRGAGRGHTALMRHDASRPADVVEAIEAIRDHLTKGDLSDGLVYDAVRVRLIEIGEAVKAVSAEVLAMRKKSLVMSLTEVL